MARFQLICGTKRELVANLQRMLKAVGVAPVTHRQKLRLHKAGIYPHLSWLLNIEELPFTWVERQLEAAATQFVKKWAGLAKSANTSLLYLPQKMGSLNKQLQVSRQCQLLTSTVCTPFSREAPTEGKPADQIDFQASSGGSRCTG